MLASPNEIMHFFEEEGFLETLWVGWESSEEEYWDAIATVIQLTWDKFGESKGYISYEDIDQVREFMVKKLQEEDPEVQSRKRKFKTDKTMQMQSDKLGNFDYSLNETVDLSKKDIQQIVRDEVQKQLNKEKYLTKDDVKNYLTQEDVKKIIRKAIVDQYKTLWMKSSFYINQI